jgi:hypothetical protein
MRYHVEAKMSDIPIRDVPEDAATPGSPVGVEDLARFADTFADLADPDVMSQAWK